MLFDAPVFADLPPYSAIEPFRGRLRRDFLAASSYASSGGS
jgi:hypothetical protein